MKQEFKQHIEAFTPLADKIKNSGDKEIVNQEMISWLAKAEALLDKEIYTIREDIEKTAKAEASLVNFTQNQKNTSINFSQEEITLYKKLLEAFRPLDQIYQDDRFKDMLKRIQEIIGLYEFLLSFFYYKFKKDEYKSKEYLISAEKHVDLQYITYDFQHDDYNEYWNFGKFLEKNNLLKKVSGSFFGGCLVPVIIGIGSIFVLLIFLIV